MEEGFASVHVSAEKSEYYKQLKTAEDNAKQRKLKIWENYEGEKTEDQIVEEEHVVCATLENTESVVAMCLLF